MRPSEIKAALSGLDMRADKRLGQHFLAVDSILERQANYASITDRDTVLEIGPGLGALTQKLLERAGHVVAIERDSRLCGYLEHNIISEKLRLICGDALEVKIPAFDKVVSNLPYSISSDITFKLLERRFTTGVLMYQKEFADRMVAGAGTDSYSRLSVGVYYRAECEILERVPRSAFYPMPDVDSALVRLTPRKKPLFDVLNEQLFFNMVGTLFAHRRKKIGTSLRLWAREQNIEKNNLKGLPWLERRAEELTPEELGKLADAIAEKT